MSWMSERLQVLIILCVRVCVYVVDLLHIVTYRAVLRVNVPRKHDQAKTQLYHSCWLAVL